MKEIEELISPFIQSQFPEFYEAEGPRFIDFVRQYYKWMESENKALNVSRSLFKIRDIDTTSDDFVVFFKEKYLKSFPLTSEINSRLFVKKASDFYNIKGTSRGIQFVLQGLFNEESSIRYPGDDVFKTSDGTWIKPVYLELTPGDRSKQYVGQEVLGGTSGAKAFVESIVRRLVAGRFVDVAYLSSVRGNFQTGEILTTSANTVALNAPRITGSMTTLEIVSGGAEFQVGDLFNVSSSNGKQGRARVASVSTETGKVIFEFVSTLESGGWGYTTTPTITISSKVLTLSSQFNSNSSVNEFVRFEDVRQPLLNVSYSTANPNNSTISNGALVTNYYANGVIAGNATIVAIGVTNSTSGYVIVSSKSGNIQSGNSTLFFGSNTSNATIGTVVDRTVTANVIGSNTTISNVFFNANTNILANTIVVLDHPFVNNQLIRYSTPAGVSVITGLTNNDLYYVQNTTITSFKISSSYNGSALTLIAPNVSANHVLTFVSGYAGVANISGGNFYASPYANIVGVTSNTTAQIANVSTGSGASFEIGQITDSESVFVSPDLLTTRNSGNVVFSSILLNGLNANTPPLSSGNTFNPSTINDATDSISTPLAANLVANDAVLYVANTGNTVPSGLTNNSVYFIQTSNSTHVSLKATKAGATIPLTVGTNEVGHNLFGPLEQTANGIPLVRGFGFEKFIASDINSVLFDCLRFETLTIGSIASLVGLNPGVDYNINPFITVAEPFVMGFNKRDYIMNVANVTGAFVEGEQVQQSYNSTAKLVTVTGWTASAANGASPTNALVGEYIFQGNSTVVIANGTVSEAGVSGGNGVIKILPNYGTFVNTTSSDNQIYTQTTGGTANITLVSTTTTVMNARAIVKEANSSVLKLKRINFENTFIANGAGQVLLGRTSGATANVISIGEDPEVFPIGLNANISSNVQVANGVATSLQVVDSGFGYLDQETVTLTKEGSPYEITAIAILEKQGQGEGFFSSTRGFLDSDKKLHDNDFYQEFSYEIETKIPFDQYFDVLKKVAHVAGTKAFGSVVARSVVDLGVTISSDIVLEENEGSYVGSYQDTFTQIYTQNPSYSRGFSRLFTGAYSELIFSGSYSDIYSGNYSVHYTKAYSEAYSSNFSIGYTSSFSKLYTVGYSTLFSTIYSKIFSTNYTLTANYTAQYATSGYASNYGGYTSGYAYTSIFGGYTAADGGYGTAASYTTAYSSQYSTYTISYDKTYSIGFTRVFGGYTGGYSQIGYTGIYVIYTGTYTTLPYTSVYGAYTRVFAFTRAFGSYSSSFSSAVWTRSYTTDNFIGVYTPASFTGPTYSGQFNSRVYTGKYRSGGIRTIKNYTGTWTGGYTRTDSVFYSGTLETGYAGSYIKGGWTGKFNRVFYTGTYTQLVPFAAAFTKAYTQTYQNNYTLTFTKAYSKSYGGEYTGIYSTLYTVAYTTTSFSRLFSRIYSNLYTAGYSGVFVMNTYTRVYSETYGSYTGGTYTSDYNGFTGPYTPIFSQGYTSTYSNVYQGSYGKYTVIYTNAYSSIYSGSFSKNYSISYTKATYSGLYGNAV